MFRDASVRNNIERIFAIWEERNIYDSEFIEDLTAILSECCFFILHFNDCFRAFPELVLVWKLFEEQFVFWYIVDHQWLESQAIKTRTLTIPIMHLPYFLGCS